MTRAAGLTWGIKDSLIAYVEGPAAGEVEVADPANRTEEGFHFPWAATDVATDPVTAPAAAGDGSYVFTGSVRFTGHWGALDVLLADPRITLTGRTGELAVRDRGHRDPTATLVIADLALVDDAVEGADARTLELTATLTAHGRFLLGAQYRIGEELAPVRLVLPARDR
ncbi:hypothetical protein GCM10011512_27280 [Tersicoccus solisilvae]|uniref:Htaa domain-containing protein n=1 Tax=Tersicoccus solisilvae TaxID=1882339 RepID=A0ABQ1PLJ7_9MICC|nr:HtaA domain-containing protein [Tersicoccus solisilvae]GGC98912.1 hypothetical protein GCM10011512_27280 [Tersicoccus solisilvae]